MTKWGLVADKLIAMLANEKFSEEEHDTIATAASYLDECDGAHLHAHAPQPEARQIVERHRRHVELSPGVGADVQRYALAVCDDILADLPPPPQDDE